MRAAYEAATIAGWHPRCLIQIKVPVGTSLQICKLLKQMTELDPASKRFPSTCNPWRYPVLAKPSHYSAIETLRNGERVEIRALRPQDRDDLIAAVSRTSSESLYRRFFAVRRHFTETEQSFYLNIDFVSHVALLALADENGQPTIIGGGRYVVDEPGQAEVAFTVVDKYQRQGVGAALLRHLVIIARQAGLRELVAYVLADNRGMLKVFEKSGLKFSAKRESNSINIRLGLA
jgi:RimJ/RimL family protein N-acetyltransferase